MENAVTLALKPQTEPIPGYHVTERLGTGGYGEVWKAEAPGGLQKAIKFIYGYLSDDKASRELKALNRIKQIRHPFLLSIERIEVVDGQLVIVTELADGSLKDRYQSCIDQGLAAIPRDELLGYLRDAADALDFLSENVLQHLDVKPENLLLVGGRAKVADFGLLKDIHDRTYSAMGGMTPVYAAPELFDGRPTSASDQYSLAIVYQEMLTGALPFPGTTAAQLTSQHLHSRPRLESLPAGDVEIIGKALSKNPLDRFASSRALIDALIRAGNGMDAGGSDASLPPDVALRDTASAAGQDTKSLAGDVKEAHRFSSRWLNVSSTSPANKATSATPESPTKTAPPPAAAITNLPKVTVDPGETGLRPTLVVGIGGTAGDVVRRFRRRLQDRFGLEKIPYIRTLLIDTDASTFSPHAGSEDALRPDDMLPMVLRKPQEYREDSLEILQWLSRRWLYNIPRSLKTEGLRPLGRLALVDHAHLLFERLREAIAEIVAPEAIEQSQQRTGLKLRSAAPRVFVVASVSGGTGGGMVLDVAYVLRMLLADMGLSAEGLCGLLLHSTQRNATAKDLAVANAYACLSELNHYIQENNAGETDGESSPRNLHSTFPAAYFVHLGDRLTDEEFSRATDSIADYLYFDAATAAGTYFDKCRTAVVNPSDGEFRFRTFGLCQLGVGQDLANQLSDFLARQVLEQWAVGSMEEPSTADRRAAITDDFPRAVVNALKLDGRSLVDHFQTELRQRCSESMIGSLAATLVRQFPPLPNETQRWPRLVSYARQSLGLIAAGEGGVKDVVCLPTATEAIIKRAFETLDGELTQWVVKLADGPGIGVGGALQQSERLIELLRQTEGELSAMSRSVQETVSQYAAHPRPANAGRKSARRTDESPAALASALTELLAVFVEQKSIEGGLRLIGALVHRMVTLSESLVRMRRDTMSLADGIHATDWHGATRATATAAPFDAAVRQLLDKRLSAIATNLQQCVAAEIIKPGGGLFRLLSATGDDFGRLPAQIRAFARRVVVEELRQMDVLGLLLSADADGMRQSLRRCIQSARPSALDMGGAQRLLVVMPAGPSSAKAIELLGPNVKPEPTVLFESDCSVVACIEGEQVSLKNLAAMLAHNDPQCVEVARRLHTRVDVRWTAL
jgi:serine/threonine protein kinase